MARKLSEGEIQRFRHNEPSTWSSLWAQREPGRKAALVVIDGVYSMGGDIAALPAILDACQRYHARLVVDDAHGLGVLGEGGGRGTASHFGTEEARVDLIMRHLLQVHGLDQRKRGQPGGRPRLDTSTSPAPCSSAPACRRLPDSRRSWPRSTC